MFKPSYIHTLSLSLSFCLYLSFSLIMTLLYLYIGTTNVVLQPRNSKKNNNNQQNISDQKLAQQTNELEKELKGLNLVASNRQRLASIAAKQLSNKREMRNSPLRSKKVQNMAKTLKSPGGSKEILRSLSLSLSLSFFSIFSYIYICWYSCDAER